MMRANILTTLSLLCVVVASILTCPLSSEAATTFVASTVVRVDSTEKTVTFRTREGQTWTLHVADPDVLKKEQVESGDQVSIEIDANDTIIKIVRLMPRPRPDQG